MQGTGIEMSEFLGQDEAKKNIERDIKNDMKKWKGWSTRKNIVFESSKRETWGHKGYIWRIDGHVECSITTGLLSSAPGKRVFSFEIDALTGKILNKEWKPFERK
jgi:hypothetical protein